MDTLFATILDDGHHIVGAEKCSLFFVDEERGELWTKVATDNRGAIKVRDGIKDVGLVVYRTAPIRATAGVAASSPKSRLSCRARSREPSPR